MNKIRDNKLARQGTAAFFDALGVYSFTYGSGRASKKRNIGN